jgi:hypothetical protein
MCVCVFVLLCLHCIMIVRSRDAIQTAFFERARVIYKIKWRHMRTRTTRKASHTARALLTGPLLGVIEVRVGVLYENVSTSNSP